MLTIDEIRNISFRKAARGYKPEDVDSFIDEVIVTVEQLKKDKTSLISKIDILAKRIELYRDDEETVRNALIASQKISDSTINDAKATADGIVSEAKRKADALVADANLVTAKQKENYISLKADAVKLREEILDIYKKHLQIISELPTEVELSKMKESVNKKYPTNAAPESAVQEESQTVKTDEEIIADAADKVEIASGTMSDNSGKTQVFNVGNDEESEKKPKKSERKNRKFNDLKFGDNYDVGE